MVIPIMVKIRFKKHQKNGQKLKKIIINLKLHLIGKLQTNKVKLALSLFDYIHSLDSKKLADKISKTPKRAK